MEKEIWRDVVGYEGMYQVSNLGRVKSLKRYSKRVGHGGRRLVNERYLKNFEKKDGYLRVYLYNNGIKKGETIHRIVAKMFIPNPENKPEVNHINGDKKDNKMINLEWVTPKENGEHAALNGLKSRGEKHIKAKLKRKNVIDIRNTKDNNNPIIIKKLANKYNVSMSTIYNVIAYRIWKHVV